MANCIFLFAHFYNIYVKNLYNVQRNQMRIDSGCCCFFQVYESHFGCQLLCVILAVNLFEAYDHHMRVPSIQDAIVQT